MKAKITLEDLRRAHACRRETLLFKRHFGKSVVITITRCREFSQVFNFDWAAASFLDRPVYHEFCKKREAVIDELTAAGRLFSRGGDVHQRFRNAEAFARLYIAQERAKSRA